MPHFLSFKARHLCSVVRLSGYHVFTFLGTELWIFHRLSRVRDSTFRATQDWMRHLKIKENLHHTQPLLVLQLRHGFLRVGKQWTFHQKLKPDMPIMHFVYQFQMDIFLPAKANSQVISNQILELKNSKL